MKEESEMSDVTESPHTAEKPYKKTEGSLTLLEWVPFGIALIAKDGTFRYINPRFKELFGYDLKDVPDGRTWFRKVYPDPAYRHNVISTWIGDLENFRAGEWKSRDFSVICKDGMEKIIQFNAVQLDTKEDLLTCVDISKRKKAEDVLKESERRQKAILDNIPDIAWLKDRENRFITANEPFGRACGARPEDLVGKTDLDIWPLELAQRYRADDQEVTRSGKRKRVEEPLADKEGRMAWIETIKTPIYNRTGEIIGTTGIARDITERKRMEAALLRAKEDWERTFDAVSDLLAILNTEFQFVRVNRAMATRLGRTPEECIGLPCYATVHGTTSPPVFCPHKRLIEDGQGHTAEVYEQHLGGYFFISVSPLRDPEGKLFGSIHILHDITAQKQAEQRLRSLASKLLLVGEQERREIAVGLHDHIGQTLAASNIKLGDLLSKPALRYKKSLNEIRELIDLAIQNTRSLTFDLSPPVLYELGLDAAIEWLAEKTQREHGFAIDVERPSGSVSMDHEIRILLFQIVRELLFNVVKHAKAQRVRISVLWDNDQMRIRVKDDGVGFDTSKIQSLSGENGGFGLFSIRERLSYIGGNLEIVSKLHLGTDVTITAPVTLKKSE